MTTCEFIFDFGSPNAYLSHKVLPALAEHAGVEFDYVPALLGGIFKMTNNVSPAISLQGVKNKPEYGRLETARFIAKHGITDYQFNPDFPVNTLQIMRGATAAKIDGFFAGYVDAVFHHMWEAPKKMDDPDVIAAALTDSGLDAAHIAKRIQDADVKQQLIRTTEDAVDRGVFGSPTFFVGSEIFFGKDKLRDVEEEIAKQRA
jgi:2-hydroxychromene-2-carboxylate isomerase